MDNKKTPPQSAADSFRSSLEDVVAVADKLSAYCNTVEEMVGMCKLGLENAGQLSVLMALMQQK